jgi:PAS domain S-box-containing protein
MHDIHQPAKNSAGPDRFPAPGSSTSPPRILLVDDQPSRLLTYESILSGLSVECVWAFSGTEALGRLLKDDFAVILLDVNMPGMDGFELARMVREHPRLEKTPIIFVTGVNVSELDQLRGYEVGAIDYIAVPVVPEILRSKVAVLVELHRRRSELQQLNHALDEARAQRDAEHAQALAYKEAQLRAVFEHPSAVIVVLRAERNADDDVVDWIYHEVNARALELLAASREAVVGRRLSEILPPDRAALVRDRCVRVLLTNTPSQYESRFGSRDFLATIYSIGNDCVVSTGIDVTERAHAEAALRDSERRYRALVEGAPVGVAHNTIEGRFEYANQAFCDLVGYTQDELHAKTWQEITHPDDLAGDAALSRRVLAKEQSHYTLEKRYIRKDGSVVWVQLSGNFVFDDRGTPVQGIAVAIDISARKQADAALRASEEALRETDRRKDEFLAMLAHELRNPVAPIGNVAEVLSRVLADDEEKKALADIIRRQAMHLSRLLDDLLDVARVTQGHIELRRTVMPLAACIQQAVETAQPLIRERQHRLTVSETFQPLHVNADRVRLAQAIANVIMNAAKYTQPGGDIRIRTFSDDRQAAVEISDNGVGIAPEFLSKVFDLFAQSDRSLDRSEGGLGVGLAVSKKLVEMHGGTVTASSVGAGFGATFTIRLPLEDTAPDTSATPESSSAPPRRVLIVDDNEDSADSLAMLLELEGHVVRAVYSAMDALEQVTVFEPEIVLLDIGLPGMNGYDVAQRINELPNPPRLVAVSGYAQREDKERSVAAGFSAHLVKPVDIAALKRVLMV